MDGVDGHAWRASAIVYGSSAPTVVQLSLDDGSAGSTVVRGFGRQVTRVVLAVSIADRAGAQVPYRYGASVASLVAAK